MVRRRSRKKIYSNKDTLAKIWKGVFQVIHWISVCNSKTGKDPVTSGIREGVHGMGGCSCKKEGEGPLYTTTQWLIEDVLLSGKSEWKKMCITRCYYLRHCVLTFWKIHKHRKGTVQSLFTSGLRVSHCPQQDQSRQARKPLPSPGDNSLMDTNFIEEKWRVWSNNSITKERC